VNRRIILTIVFNFFILIGAGHGIGFLGLFEILGFKEFIAGDVKFSLSGDHENRLFTAAIISLVGQIILLRSFYEKALLTKFTIIYVGLFILFFSFFVLANDLFNSELDAFSFWTGTPFLIFAIMLLVRTIKNHRSLLNENKEPSS